MHTRDGAVTGVEVFCGTKQGDPVSAILFILIFDVRLSLLHELLVIGEILTAFADDVALILQCTLRISVMFEFCQNLAPLSNLWLNPGKCQWLLARLPSLADRSFYIGHSQSQVLREVKLVTIAKLLGIYLSVLYPALAVQRQYQEIYRKAVGVAAQWKTAYLPGLTAKGRVLYAPYHVSF